MNTSKLLLLFALCSSLYINTMESDSDSSGSSGDEENKESKEENTAEKLAELLEKMKIGNEKLQEQKILLRENMERITQQIMAAQRGETVQHQLYEQEVYRRVFQNITNALCAFLILSLFCDWYVSKFP
jgi:hypothetical protein